MDKIRNTKTFMRITHRYLGYFLAGMMAVYAISGVLLVYRDTGFLKKRKATKRNLNPIWMRKNWVRKLKSKASK
jgi:hypothetical protein